MKNNNLHILTKILTYVIIVIPFLTSVLTYIGLNYFGMNELNSFAIINFVIFNKNLYLLSLLFQFVFLVLYREFILILSQKYKQLEIFNFIIVSFLSILFIADFIHDFNLINEVII